MSGLPDCVTPVSQAMYEEIYESSLIACQVMLVLYGIVSLQSVGLQDLGPSYPPCGSLYIHLPSLTIPSALALTLVSFYIVTHTVYHYSVKSYLQPIMGPGME
ncbi:hypothetical protein BDN71DRAFT_1436440 [Pleurotus eryngii]|uniref:Uncharacterized protein n=1 Tax=Pleurotus eryngii TaxID=5323 RepID=A0A9P5ZIC3_PLEER|nr:hypothetical protein BDN71DRAFT_1436440 [Pleurotus eryngii]